ncbi:MAG: hypothetical protein ABSC94_04825 [Polyangiaceae bacterium]
MASSLEGKQRRPRGCASAVHANSRVAHVTCPMALDIGVPDKGWQRPGILEVPSP